MYVAAFRLSDVSEDGVGQVATFWVKEWYSYFLLARRALFPSPFQHG
jgi:hypothetical protein